MLNHLLGLISNYRNQFVLTVKILLLTILLVFFGLSSKGQSVNLLTLKFQSAPLKEVIAAIEHQSDYSFVFSGNQIDLNKKISISSNEAKISEVLNRIFDPAEVHYVIIGNQIVLTSRKGNTDTQKQTKHTINGYIRDAKSGENLIGATVYDLNSQVGTTTNNYGFYSVTLASQNIDLHISYVGFQANRISFTAKDTTINTGLFPNNELDEVVVSSVRPIEMVTQMSKINVPVEQIKAAPVLFGETDLLKTLQLLPGIRGGTEGSSGTYVRGGGPDQNLILLDGVPMYNVSHLFGFFSAFNADAINDVSVIKGGFPARYGGRLSSVIDIKMKEGNNQEFHSQGSIGLISSKFTIEGPIKNEKTSFILSARRTYLDLLTAPIFLVSSKGKDNRYYNFYDINSKINHRLSDNDRLYLSIYHGGDIGKQKSEKSWEEYGYNQQTPESTLQSSNTLDKESSLGWTNTMVGFRWNHVFSQKLFSNLSTNWYLYNYGVTDLRDEVITDYVEGTHIREVTHSKYESSAQDLRFESTLDYYLSSYQKIKAGSGLVFHKLGAGVVGYTSSVRQNPPVNKDPIKATEYYAFIEDDLSLFQNFSLNLGTHYSSYHLSAKKYSAIQPRVTSRIMLGQVAFKASYSYMYQYVHLLTNSIATLPTDLWVSATETVKPQSAHQWTLGVAKTIKNIDFSIETYYKEMHNLIEYSEGSTFINNPGNWQNKVVTGDGESYGIELLAHKKIGKLNGWIGYTLSKSDRKFEDLNFGKRYPYNYDRRHDISLVGNYKLKRNISLSGSWIYSSGIATNIPKQKYTTPYDLSNYTEGSPNTNSTVIMDYGAKNSFRFRDYHRLDVSITFEKQKAKSIRTLSIGAYNVYSRLNPYYMDIEYNSKRGRWMYKEYSLFPIIPSITYGFKF